MGEREIGKWKRLMGKGRLNGETHRESLEKEKGNWGKEQRGKSGRKIVKGIGGSGKSKW